MSYTNILLTQIFPKHKCLAFCFCWSYIWIEICTDRTTVYSSPKLFKKGSMAPSRKKNIAKKAMHQKYCQKHHCQSLATNTSEYNQTTVYNHAMNEKFIPTNTRLTRSKETVLKMQCIHLLHVHWEWWNKKKSTKPSI